MNKRKYRNENRILRDNMNVLWDLNENCHRAAIDLEHDRDLWKARALYAKREFQSTMRILRAIEDWWNDPSSFRTIEVIEKELIAQGLLKNKTNDPH